MSRFRRFAALTTVGFFASLLFSGVANALLLKADDDLVLNTFLTEDVYLAGGSVTIQQDIEGDLLVAGGDVTVNGAVNGDVFVAGGTVLINGVVKDDLRMVGGTLNLNGSVGGDLVVIGGEVDVNQGVNINGDVVLVSGKTNLYGTVNRSVNGVLGRLVIGGTVNGNVHVRATEKVVLLNSGRIAGDLTYLSPERLEDHGGVIDGETSFNAILSSTDKVKEGLQQFLSGGYVLGKLWSLLSLLLIGSLIVAFMPNLFHRASERIHGEGLKSLGIGFLVFVLAGFASLLAVLTVIGVQLGFIVIALLFVLGEVGRIATAYWLGSLIVRDDVKKGIAKKRAFGKHFLVLLLGLFIFKLIGLIPVFGWFVGLLAFLIGSGAIVMVQRTAYRQLIKERML